MVVISSIMSEIIRSLPRTPGKTSPLDFALERMMSSFISSLQPMLDVSGHGRGSDTQGHAPH
jgi:hypothetical protein